MKTSHPQRQRTGAVQVELIRDVWETLTNAALLAAGFEARIDSEPLAFSTAILGEVVDQRPRAEFVVKIKRPNEQMAAFSLILLNSDQANRIN